MSLKYQHEEKAFVFKSHCLKAMILTDKNLLNAATVICSYRIVQNNTNRFICVSVFDALFLCTGKEGIIFKIDMFAR